MAKLIILSIVLVSFVLPIYLATASHPVRTLRRMQGIMFLYILFWSYLCLHWYPILVPLQ
jgi:hypothetical protein